MAEAFKFGYGSPSTFSDWANYAGLDRRTGMMRPASSSSGEAIKPMTNIPEQDMSPGIPPIVPPSITPVSPMGNPAAVMPTSSMGGTSSSLEYVMKFFGG